MGFPGKGPARAKAHLATSWCILGKARFLGGWKREVHDEG